jgi:peptide/nickel transport system ATP-binding protein
MSECISLQGLGVQHGHAALVSPIDLEFRPGEAITILGESGSGKSLLAHAIMGTCAANLRVQGTLHSATATYNLADPNNRRHLWGRELAILPQEPLLSLDPTQRTLHQVAEGLRPTPHWAQAGERARELLARLGLAGKDRHYPHTLSGGMAQRVAFAASTIGGARFLIADEPSKGLDAAARNDLVDLLRRHLEQNGLLLTITHDIEVARQLGGRILVMKDSDVVEQGPAASLLGNPAHAYTRRLLAAEPAAWGNVDHPARGELLIGARGISKSFPPVKLFADVHLDLHAGERIALLAPSGKGKTTLGNVLLKLLPADGGSLHHAPGLANGAMQKLYQDPVTAFAPRLTLQQAFHDLLKRHRLHRDSLAPLLERLQLPPSLLARLPAQVSGGELQRLALIRALLLKPRLIFADEPTSRLDPITQQETFRVLLQELKAIGCALLLVTHDEILARKASVRTLRLDTGIQEC